MATLNTKLILSLIKAEMKSYKFIQGLDNAGALVEDFYIDLDRIILDLLGFEEEEEQEGIFKIYDLHLENLKEIPVDDFNEMLNDLAINLYVDLLAEKKLKDKLKEAELKSDE